MSDPTRYREGKRLCDDSAWKCRQGSHNDDCYEWVPDDTLQQIAEAWNEEGIPYLDTVTIRMDGTLAALLDGL